MKASRKATGWAAAAAVFVAGFEGVRQVAYKDPIGVVTVCAGETRGVKMGDRYSLEECHAMLANRLVEFDAGVRACVPGALPDPTRVAFVSLAYNIGVGGFCKSSVVRLWNAGHRSEACDFMLKFNRAGGVVWPGLTRRRVAERELCRQGL